MEINCLPGRPAQHLYLDVNAYANSYLSRIPVADGAEVDLVGDMIGIKIMLANQLLDDDTLDPIRARDDPSRERVSRLWRGFDAASDAARWLVNHYECDTDPPTGAHCTLVPDLYDRAARALALVIDIGGADTEDAGIDTEVAFGVGVGALHWAQDPRFRQAARPHIAQPDLIREAEEATFVRADSPRYPTGLAMLYCLAGRYDDAQLWARAIRHQDPKYQSVRLQVFSCEGADLESHFDRTEPSE